MVIAKDPETHRILAKQFEERSAGRIYLAIVKGSLSGVIDDPKSNFRQRLRDSSANMALSWNRKDKTGRFVSFLSRDPIRRTSFKVDMTGAGRKASTEFHHLASFEDYSLIALKLGTGRTHQIRVHLNFFGLPIVGDTLYGGPAFKGDSPEAEASFLLHARTLYLKDPTDGQERAFNASIPEYFLQFCRKCGLSSGEVDFILKQSWQDWNSIFLKAGAED